MQKVARVSSFKKNKEAPSLEFSHHSLTRKKLTAGIFLKPKKQESINARRPFILFF
jgi:hypothetical protein